MTPAVGQLSRSFLLFAALAMAFAGPVLLSSSAVAQTAKTKPAADPADGRKAVIAGIKAYESGQSDKAVSILTGAMSSGGLSSQDLAKALYFRGLAHHRSKKSAQAIADLTSAVWMKGGLSPSEQQNALKVRGEAYAAVGVADPGPPGQSVGAPAVAEAAPAAAPKPSSGPAAKPGVTPPPSATAAATKPDSQAPSAGFTTKVAKATDAAGSDAGASGTQGSGDALSGVGNFFSNLFSGGSSSSPAEPQSPPAATGALSPPSTGGSSAAVSAWSSETSVSTAEAEAAPARQRPSKKAVKNSVPSGDYKLQVAAVRSRGEAERLAAQLRQKHAGRIGTRVPHISETVFGNMGTFYQVNVGPFAKTAETDVVCKALKADGFDCLVVKQ